MSSNISLNLTGLDTDSIVQNLMALERQPLYRLQSQQAALLTKKTAWSAVKSQIDNLSSKISPLTQSASFVAKTAVVSDASVLSATGSATSTPGTYQIQVASLAAAQVAQSSALGSTTDPFDPPLAGTITLNGQSIAILATDSLETVTAKINATANVDASAAILQTEPDKYRMILTSSETGEAGAMEFGGDLAIWRALGVLDGSDVVNEVKAAGNALFTINGVQFTRSDNSVTDAIPGVTFSLLEDGAEAKATITVGYDDAAVITSVKAFVSEYNNVIDTVSKYNGWDPDSRVAGALFGDPLVTGLLAEMRTTVFGDVTGAGDAYSTLSTVGISTGSGTSYSKEGRLTLDETKLRDALKADRDAVALLFGARTANAALSSSGATATGTSTLDPALYPASSVTDGNTSSALWGSGGGWSDATAGDFSDDRLEIDFGQSRLIDKVSVFTVDSALFPAESFGIRDFNLEYWDGAGWAALGAAVTGSTSALKTVYFDAVATSKIRLNVTDSNDHQYARVVEMQAFQENDGAFSRLSDIANRYAATDGFLTNRTLALDAEDTALQRRIDDMQKRLEAKEVSLRRQYTALEVTLQKLNTQSAWLTQQINSMTTQQE